MVGGLSIQMLFSAHIPCYRPCQPLSCVVTTHQFKQRERRPVLVGFGSFWRELPHPQTFPLPLMLRDYRPSLWGWMAVVVVCKMISFAETAGYRRVEGDSRQGPSCVYMNEHRRGDRAPGLQLYFVSVHSPRVVLLLLLLKPLLFRREGECVVHTWRTRIYGDYVIILG